MKISAIVILLTLVEGIIRLSLKEKHSGTYYQSTEFTAPFQFTAGIEGPATDKNGRLFAVNYAREGTIGLIDSFGTPSIFVTLPDGSVGNSVCFASNGEMRIADYVRHNIFSVNMTTKAITIFSHHSEMNQPNDLCITRSDRIYASDPKWADGTGNLWMINADGSIVLLEDSMGTTNGIELSPDEQVLYVNESIQRTVWRYNIDRDGNLSDKQLLIQFSDGGLDGMKCDREGNLYIARYGTGSIAVVTPEGKLIREVKLIGQKPTNIVFGGIDGRVCYVTMQDRGNIELFYVEIPGKQWF